MKTKMITKLSDCRVYSLFNYLIAFVLMALGCYQIYNDDSSFLIPLGMFISSVMILSATLITSCESAVIKSLRKQHLEERNG